MTRSTGSARRAGATSKGEHRRAELLDIAEQILVESGYSELTMRAVAAKAQVRLGHLQYYFPNRDNLVHAVLQRTLESSLGRLEPLLSRPVTAQSAEDLVHVLLAEQDDPRLTRIYTELWALASRDATIAEAMRTFYRDYQAHVAAVVHARSPALTAEICEARARVFTILIEGAALFRSGVAAHADPNAEALLIATAATLLDAESEH
ncbi:TetR/AcrR family transcriptional regulator [Nocardia sp. NPDC059239]|uniref:TetR/AcrR family transcriptional regulator n=1 Tax=unclassified Nocardia TaxID=2637762 RepID=UPI0036BE370C